MSTSEVSTSELSEPPADISHLLTTDEVMYPAWGSRCSTLCGAMVHMGRTGVTPEHCPGCKCVPRLCAECVEQARQWDVDI